VGPRGIEHLPAPAVKPCRLLRARRPGARIRHSTSAEGGTMRSSSSRVSRRAPGAGPGWGRRGPRRGRARRHHHVGRPHHAGVALARPRRDRGDHHALHGALCAPRRAGEADAGGHQYPEPRGVVDAVEGRAHLRVRPPQGREVPQRRAGHGVRREVLLRPVQGRGREAPQGARSRRAGGGPGPRALRPQGAVAGLHDVLRNLRHRLRLGRAQGLCRKGRRRRLQAGADRRRPYKFVSFNPGSSW
jgi:hypothetical protein